MGVANYYSILMIGEDATQEEVKKAYRRCARLYHPDVSGHETAEKFKEVVKAYKVLGDPDERGRYDDARKIKQRDISIRFSNRMPNSGARGKTSAANINLHHSSPTSIRKEPPQRHDGQEGWAKDDPELVNMPVDELLDRVRNSTNRYVRQKAIELLEKRQALEAVGHLIESLNDPIKEVQIASLRALGELRSRRAARAVAIALGSPYWQIRYQALVALGKIGSRQVAPMVAKLLDDPYIPVREEAVRILGVIGDRKDIRILKGRMKNEDKAIKRSIRDAISKLKLG